MADPVDDKSEQKVEEVKTNQENSQGQSVTEKSDTTKVDTSKSELEDYKKKVEPILQAIYRDPNVYSAVNKSYQELMGIKQPEKEDNKEEKDTKEEVKKVEVNPIENDNRNALITQTVQNFEQKHGMDKLKPEDKATLNNKILTELKVILDPGDTGKSGADLLSGVPVAKVGDYLDRAYYLATREDREAKLRENAANEAITEERGLMGSIPGGSISESDVKLTEKEKGIARKQGVSEEKYLANKKEILKRKGSIA